MDGVLVNIKSSWAFVHKAFNVDETEMFKQYLRGAFDYSEFLRRDIGFWGSIHINEIRNILNQVPEISCQHDISNRGSGQRDFPMGHGLFAYGSLNELTCLRERIYQIIMF